MDPPYFVPKSITVSTGSPIRWENPTAAEHTVTHTGCVEDGDHCAFDSGLMLTNGTFALPGLAPGRYPYRCRIHPIMSGVITVTEAPQLPSQLQNSSLWFVARISFLVVRERRFTFLEALRESQPAV